MFSFKSDEKRRTDLETKLEKARHGEAEAREALAAASLVAEETGNRRELDGAEKAHAAAATRRGQLELALERLQTDLAAKQAREAAEAQAAHEAAGRVAHDGLRAAVGELDQAFDAIERAATAVGAAIRDYAPFASSDDGYFFDSFRRALPFVFKWHIQGITDQKPVALGSVTDSAMANLLRWFPAKSGSRI